MGASSSKRLAKPALQRWLRPLDVEPGHWKQQLAVKYLTLAAKGRVDELKGLLKRSPAALNQRGNHGRTLLWEATRAGRLEAVKFLVNRGANVELTGCFNRDTFVQISPASAAHHYKRRDVAVFLKKHAKPPDVFQSAFLGDVARLKQCLARTAGAASLEDPDNEIYFTPPLSFAIAGGQLEAAQVLLEAGASIAEYSGQLLQVAAGLGRLDVLEHLLGWGVAFASADGSIFGVARDMQVVRFLLDQGVRADQASMNGFPPLVYLARGDNGATLERMQALIERGADINITGPKRRTALHYAAAAGAAAKVSWLLANGASPHMTDDEGYTPQQLAEAKGKQLDWQ